MPNQNTDQAHTLIELLAQKGITEEMLIKANRLYLEGVAYMVQVDDTEVDVSVYPDPSIRQSFLIASVAFEKGRIIIHLFDEVYASLFVTSSAQAPQLIYQTISKDQSTAVFFEIDSFRLF